MLFRALLVLIVPNMETALACGSEMRCEILLLWQWVRMCINCFSHSSCWRAQFSLQVGYEYD